MFEVEKPRKFHYAPRFYDPEKERWEAKKKRYAIEQERTAANSREDDVADEGDGNTLEYFERRVAEVNREQRRQASRLTWKDLFRKREMPRFEYQSRLNIQESTTATQENPKDGEADTLTEKYRSPRRIKIRRRFDISDTDYMKPISGTKIILYCFVVFLLVTLILKF